MSTPGNADPASGTANDASSKLRPEISVMDGSPSSKVTVEYYDPSGIFPLISEQLKSRLPLRNLHWKSPNRPLRSIDSLHVNLVPSQGSVNAPATAPQANLTPGEPGITASTPSSSEISRAPAKERRHQIPGLRKTPYLKIYLLRCDDSDTYKNTARKQLRDWVKANTPPSQSSSSASTQENHDAFEWLIVHVVLPETPAASQPRVGSSAAAGSTEKSEKSSSSRWGRGSSTILEKIRSDFNVSSKAAPDKVAQIRLQKDMIPPHMLPATSGITSPPITESPQEQQVAWNDLITKFKVLILLSFDLRVSQYEEDIREKDSQRALPGWNFCTFFILKEGLARALESVGLVEDALVGYDELSIGLDSIIRDQANEGGQEQGGVFLDFTEELYQQLFEISKRTEDESTSKGTSPFDSGLGGKPIDSNKKNYRDLILSNNISIFDFRCYIFARQMSLLLRLGNAQSPISDLNAKPQGRPSPGTSSRSVDDISLGTRSEASAETVEDLMAYAELCYRALNFITFAARILRQDFVEGIKSHSSPITDDLITTVVSSWTYAAAQQVLDQTSTLSLPISKFHKDSATGSSGKMRAFGKHAQELKVNVAEPKTMLHPVRSSSLSHRRTSVADAPYAAQTGQVVYDHGRFEERPSPGQESGALQPKSGVQELAANRAQLLIVQRRIVEQLGKRLGWHIGWEAIISSQSDRSSDMGEVDLDDSSAEPAQDASATERPKGTISSSIGVCATVLAAAVASIDEFRSFYEKLSDVTVKHYMAAGQAKSAESILGDLAALRYELGDYAAAAMYFSRMAPLFAESRWNYVETTMLKMYAQCLKKLNRKDEYVRTLLDLLAKSATKQKSIYITKPQASPTGWLDDDKVDTSGLFQELISFSSQLPYDVTVPMTKYFGDINVEPYVRHYDDKDGFQLRLQFRHVLEDDIELRRAKVRLVSSSSHGKEIWLETTESLSLKRGLGKYWVHSNMNTTGAYIVDKILVEANKIVFSYEPFKKAEATTPLGITTSVSATSLKAAKKSRVLCFPRLESLQAKVVLSRFIHIDKPRSIEIECSSGWNDIERADIRLRSASAGLRLRTSNTTTVSGDVAIADKSKPGILSISHMSPNASTKFQLPYEVETALPELVIKLEVDYYTKNGQFQYFSSCTIPIELPLDVNVHDHFKSESLFSKFNIKTANNIPLEVLDVGLEGNEGFDVKAPRKIPNPTHVFPKQPVAVTYKITTKEPSRKAAAGSKSSGASSLPLTVDYRCLDEDITSRLEEFFDSEIENGPLHRLSRLLVPSFVERLEQRILPGQFEKICLVDQVDLGSFEDMDWSECIESLPHIVRDDTRNWLRKWHEAHKIISLSDLADQDTERPYRRIIITVAIPRTHILNTVSLSLHTPSSSHPTIATVGKLLPATLRISHTRRWAQSPTITENNQAQEFVYSIDVNPEVWLIAGPRRSHFSAREGEIKEFPVHILPLRPGNLLLPSISIETVNEKGQGREESGGAGGEDEISSETDYLSHAETVMVIPDVKSATVGIGRFGSGQQPVLVGREGRE